MGGRLHPPRSATGRRSLPDCGITERSVWCRPGLCKRAQDQHKTLSRRGKRGLSSFDDCNPEPHHLLSGCSIKSRFSFGWLLANVTSAGRSQLVQQTARHAAEHPFPQPPMSVTSGDYNPDMGRIHAGFKLEFIHYILTQFRCTHDYLRSAFKHSNEAPETKDFVALVQPATLYSSNKGRSAFSGAPRSTGSLPSRGRSRSTSV